MAKQGARATEEASSPVNPDAMGATHVRDKREYVRFNFRTRPSELKERVQLAMTKMRENPSQRCPVAMDSVANTDDGFVCQWKQPRRLNVVWMFSSILQALAWSK